MPWEDGYLQPLAESPYKHGLYGVAGCPDTPPPHSWQVMIFARHVCLFGVVPEKVKTQIFEDSENRSKALIIETMQNKHTMIGKIREKYLDVDHTAVWRKNMEHLHAEAERITGKKIPKKF